MRVPVPPLPLREALLRLLRAPKARTKVVEAARRSHTLDRDNSSSSSVVMTVLQRGADRSRLQQELPRAFLLLGILLLPLQEAAICREGRMR